MEKKPKLKVVLTSFNEQKFLNPAAKDKTCDELVINGSKTKIRVKNLSSEGFKILSRNINADTPQNIDVGTHCKDGSNKKTNESAIIPTAAISSKRPRGRRKKPTTESAPEQPLDLAMHKSGKSASTSAPAIKPAIVSNICRYCGKYYATEKQLADHEVCHTMNKELSCPQCGMGFARRSYLAEHACIHSGEKPHECYYCHRAFTLRCNLVRHVRIHTNDKPYICDICKKKFILKKNMIEHRRTHTGEKPFPCEFCEFTFSRRSSLVRHSRIHTKEKFYECHDCRKTFSWKYYLRRHMTVHLQKKTHLRKQRRSKKMQNPVKPAEVKHVNCDFSNGGWNEENFVEHSYAMYSPEQSYSMDDNTFEMKEEESAETENMEFKEDVNEYKDAENSPETAISHMSQQLTVVVSPVIVDVQSAVEASDTSSEDDLILADQNDIISFKMTKNEFESFCGRRLHVRLHRLEDLPPVELHEE